MSTLLRHHGRIEIIRSAVHWRHEVSGLGDIHGPDHWNRVRKHAQALAEAEGVDPLVPTLFALVHDSHRRDESADPLHGARAAQWVLKHRNSLFSFLGDDDLQTLMRACRDHSRGFTEAPKAVMVCWDADRLDLGREGVWLRPDPRYLCTQTAKDDEVIAAACRLNGFSDDEDMEDRVLEYERA